MLNLDAEWTSVDPMNWTALQTEICINVATAKLAAFEAEAFRAAELVRLGLIPRAMAADYLQEAAVYNQLCVEYGTDRIQKIMAEALESEAA